MPGVNAYNGSLGSSIIATSPGPYQPGDVAIADHIADQVTAYLAINPTATKRAAVVWTVANDAGHWCLYQWGLNNALTAPELGATLDVDVIVRLDNYLAALFSAGIDRVVVCTEPPLPTYYGGPGNPVQDATDRIIASFNAYVLSLDGSDPRIIVADLATAPGLVLAADGGHYNDYGPHAAYLLPFCQAAVA